MKNLTKNIVIASLLILTSNAVFAKEITRQIPHDYRGVSGCNESQLEEARKAVNAYQQGLKSKYKEVELVGFELKSEQTSKWEDKGFLGDSKGRKCKGHLEIKVTYDVN